MAMSAPGLKTVIGAVDRLRRSIAGGRKRGPRPIDLTALSAAALRLNGKIATEADVIVLNELLVGALPSQRIFTESLNRPLLDFASRLFRSDRFEKALLRIGEIAKPEAYRVFDLTEGGFYFDWLKDFTGFDRDRLASWLGRFSEVSAIGQPLLLSELLADEEVGLRSILLETIASKAAKPQTVALARTVDAYARIRRRLAGSQGSAALASAVVEARGAAADAWPIVDLLMIVVERVASPFAMAYGADRRPRSALFAERIADAETADHIKALSGRLIARDVLDRLFRDEATSHLEKYVAWTDAALGRSRSDEPIRSLVGVTLGGANAKVRSFALDGGAWRASEREVATGDLEAALMALAPEDQRTGLGFMLAREPIAIDPTLLSGSLARGEPGALRPVTVLDPTAGPALAPVGPPVERFVDEAVAGRGLAALLKLIEAQDDNPLSFAATNLAPVVTGSDAPIPTETNGRIIVLTDDLAAARTLRAPHGISIDYIALPECAADTLPKTIAAALAAVENPRDDDVVCFVCRELDYPKHYLAEVARAVRDLPADRIVAGLDASEAGSTIGDPEHLGGFHLSRVAWLGGCATRLRVVRDGAPSVFDPFGTRGLDVILSSDRKMLVCGSLGLIGTNQKFMRRRPGLSAAETPSLKIDPSLDVDHGGDGSALSLGRLHDIQVAQAINQAIALPSDLRHEFTPRLSFSRAIAPYVYARIGEDAYGRFLEAVSGAGVLLERLSDAELSTLVYMSQVTGRHRAVALHLFEALPQLIATSRDALRDVFQVVAGEVGADAVAERVLAALPTLTDQQRNGVRANLLEDASKFFTAVEFEALCRALSLDLGLHTIRERVAYRVGNTLAAFATGRETDDGSSFASAFLARAAIETKIKFAAETGDAAAVKALLNEAILAGVSMTRVVDMVRHQSFEMTSLGIKPGDVAYKQLPPDMQVRVAGMLGHASVVEPLRAALPALLPDEEAAVLDTIFGRYDRANRWLSDLAAADGAEHVALAGNGVAEVFETLLADGGLPKEPSAGRVSVIMTVFEPDLALMDQSIRSIARQTYEDVELIVVDDASSEELRPQVAALAAKYGAVFIQMEQNSGPYIGRNKALEIATGAFIAIQDGDDISHPRRFAYQVARLTGPNKSMMSTSRHVRIDQSGAIQFEVGRLMTGDGTMSSMFRREAFDEIGGFMPVRSRGDVEFRERLTTCYGEAAHAIMRYPLLYCFASPSTLSNRTLRRKEYYLKAFRTAFERRHRAGPRRLVEAHKRDGDMGIVVPPPLRP